MKEIISSKKGGSLEIQDSKHANFEDAIKATGFGKFNILLLCIAVPCSFAQIVEMNGTSFVIPIAQCDLNLSLEDKGLLNSTGYIGMLLTGLLWGYICDTYGRRKIIVYGYTLNSLCHILAGSSQNFPMLLVIRFCSGLTFAGPFSALTSYLSEFHSTENRAKIQLIRGMACALGNIILPLVAWTILQKEQAFYLTDNLVLHSWNLYFMALSLPALISVIMFIFMPESPKFLMTQGKYEEALKVFQMVHRINSGKSNCYPVIYLMDENQTKKNFSKNFSTGRRLLNGFQSVKPLFCKPHVSRLIHACVNIWSLCIGIFGLKLWYPQILQSINDNEKVNGAGIGFCNIVESISNINISSTDSECTVNLDNSDVYINSIIVGSVTAAVFFLGGLGVNKLGKKTLVAYSVFIASICPIILYFFSNTTLMLVLLPILLAFGDIGMNILLTVTLELFPTSFRITAVNVHLMSLRFAVVLGNVIFPSLLMAGCLTLLMFVTLCLFVTVTLTSLLPSTENRALQ